MFIDISTEEDYKDIKPNNTITLALVGDMSNVTVTLQQKDGSGGWNDVVVEGVTQVLDVNNTLLSIFAPVELRIHKSAGSNCGVDLVQKR